jgi:hypothetical protein
MSNPNANSVNAWTTLRAFSAATGTACSLLVVSDGANGRMEEVEFLVSETPGEPPRTVYTMGRDELEQRGPVGAGEFAARIACGA